MKRVSLTIYNAGLVTSSSISTNERVVFVCQKDLEIHESSYTCSVWGNNTTVTLNIVDIGYAC